MSSNLVRYAALLLSGSALSMKAIFLHRYFHDWRRLRKLTPLAGGARWEVVVYHAGVSLVVLSITVSQVFALSLGGYKLNPGLGFAFVGLVGLDVSMWRTAIRLGPNEPVDNGHDDTDTGSLEDRD